MFLAHLYRMRDYLYNQHLFERKTLNPQSLVHLALMHRQPSIAGSTECGRPRGRRLHAISHARVELRLGRNGGQQLHRFGRILRRDGRFDLRQRRAAGKSHRPAPPDLNRDRRLL